MIREIVRFCFAMAFLIPMGCTPSEPAEAPPQMKDSKKTRDQSRKLQSRTFMDEFEKKAHALVLKMTLEEKASLCSGRDFWSTRPIERLKIPSISVADGPYGLRKASGVDVTHSVPATCFPTVSAMASTWNTALIEQVGEALGNEAQANDVQILLGPAANMKRSPLGGRNFEYFSEDPLLSGKMAAAFIKGVQSRGVGTSMKHFTANNQEFERMTNSSEVDERTLFEIYLPSFEIAVKESQPWSIMCAYNKLNGVYASENRYLLNDVLRTQFGFRGFVVSDWGAVNDRVEGIKAGLNLEMPGNGGINDKRIVQAVNNGQLEEAMLNEVVETTLAIILKADSKRKKNVSFKEEIHHELARQVSQESIVLLKNDGAVLPIRPEKVSTLALIGAFAKNPRYQGAGSSQINPTMLANPHDEMLRLLGEKVSVRYAPGYNIDQPQGSNLVDEAQKIAQSADMAVLFVGLPDSFESEGFDRSTIEMPESHIQLIDKVSAVQQDTVVVLMNGSAVAMPFVDNANVKGIVEAWLGGQAGGGAVADVLTGRVNPSGKLSETFPKRLEDTPTGLDFPNRDGTARYGEGVYIGYRYYEKKKLAPLFPFGHGLSYTEFAYTDIALSASHITDADTLKVAVTLKNKGKVAGKEVVQLYVHDRNASVSRPVKELRGFRKIPLEPGEESTVAFELKYRDFATYNAKVHRWIVNQGTFDILVGGSSADPHLKSSVEVTVTKPVFPELTRSSMVKAFENHPKGHKVYEEVMATVKRKFGPTGKETTPEQKEAQAKSERMMVSVFRDLPIYKLATLFNDMFSEEKLQELLDKAQVK